MPSNPAICFLGLLHRLFWCNYFASNFDPFWMFCDLLIPESKWWLACAWGLRQAFPWVVSMDVQWMFLETYQPTGIHIFLPCARWHHGESQSCCISDPNVHSWSIFLSKFRPLAFWIHIHGIPFWIEKHRPSALPSPTRPGPSVVQCPTAFHGSVTVAPSTKAGMFTEDGRFNRTTDENAIKTLKSRMGMGLGQNLGIFQRNALMNVHHKQYFDMNYRLTVGYQGFMIHSHVG